MTRKTPEEATKWFAENGFTQLDPFMRHAPVYARVVSGTIELADSELIESGSSPLIIAPRERSALIKLLGAVK